MIIKDERAITITAKEVNIGEVITSIENDAGNMIYLRIPTVKDACTGEFVNLFCLNDNELYFLTDDEPVKRLQATITIK